MGEARQKLRARFAMWVLGLISPWLQLWEEPPPEDLEDYEDPYTEAMNAAYDAGAERGWQEGYDDARHDSERGRW